MTEQEKVSEAASQLASRRWNKPKWKSKKTRKEWGKKLAASRSLDHQSKAAIALNNQMTVQQKHERAMKGVEARRLKKLNQLKT